MEKVESLLPGDISMETVRLSDDQPPIVRIGQSLTEHMIETLKEKVSDISGFRFHRLNLLS